MGGVWVDKLIGGHGDDELRCGELVEVLTPFIGRRRIFSLLIQNHQHSGPPCALSLTLSLPMSGLLAVIRLGITVSIVVGIVVGIAASGKGTAAKTFGWSSQGMLLR